MRIHMRTRHTHDFTAHGSHSLFYYPSANNFNLTQRAKGEKIQIENYKSTSLTESSFILYPFEILFLLKLHVVKYIIANKNINRGVEEKNKN